MEFREHVVVGNRKVGIKSQELENRVRKSWADDRSLAINLELRSRTNSQRERKKQVWILYKRSLRYRDKDSDVEEKWETWDIMEYNAGFIIRQNSSPDL